MTIDLRHGLGGANLKYALKLCADSELVVWSETPFPLKAGGTSRVYVNGRNDVTENTSLLRQLGIWITRTAQDAVGPDEKRKLIFIGMPTAGTPLATAAALSSASDRFGCRTMRTVPKTTHGRHNSWVDGAPNPSQHRYILVDNVITDGLTKREGAEQLRESGYPVDELVHVVLVDRQQGAIEKLREEGFNIHAVLNFLDLVWAYGELGLWPVEQVHAVEEEIAQLTH